MKVERVDHIHIAVKDLDRTMKFFSKLLGTSAKDFIISEEPNYHVKSATTPQGLDLMQPTRPDAPLARFLERRGEGVWAISFKVANLEEAVAELEALGLRPPVRVDEGRLRQAQFHPKDSFGVLIELCEYTEEHGAAQAALGK